ncbi:DNA cytosine methyltransferase [Thalassobius sp. Cn5-15]|uniref:DNA cytosine methyltransferase n=1 Tax=Thalassobius sp. Cn5-15 TaxID=2917763 RepID=UPI001EF2D99F|nr:DNA cytosine methyltransferase [Thalassobius sp. Cn5-15]MCG7492429.1 DNA cytosine methyltransferase [Thalassobius sp. Cn5-15]
MLDSLFSHSDLAQPVCEKRPLIIDSFAGGGGASTGIAQALGCDPDFAINHDPLALSMHAANHPNTTHLITSVYAVDPRDLVRRGQKVGLLWASPDCTHFSRARGSAPTSDRVRGLAWVVPHWLEVLGPAQSPDVILLENVEEFQTWEDFKPWCAKIRSHGYRMEFRVLQACDYGAPTIRKRLFMVARRDGRQIVWPESTHGDPKSPEVLAGKRLPWPTAASCIDWSVPMPSIFDTKEHIKATMGINAQRPLADNTQARIAAGIKKFVIEANEPFFVSYAQQGGANRSANDPMHTLCASRKDQNQIVATKLRLAAGFMAQHNTGVVGRDLNAPLSTLTTRGTQQQLVAAHLINMRGTKQNQLKGRSLLDPMPTITSGGGHAALVAAFMVKFYGTGIGASLHESMHTVTTKDRFALVTINIGGEPYVITDICMRMLTPREQFRAMGFPEGYKIERGHDGRKLSKTDQTHKCGNSVPPPLARALSMANCTHLYQ